MKTNDEQKRKIIIYVVVILVTLVLGTLLFNVIFFQHEEGLVYVTRTGECYHTSWCFYLKSVIKMGIEQAKKSGYRACSYCHGTPNGTILVNNYFASFGLTLLIIAIIFAIIYFRKQKTKDEN